MSIRKMFISEYSESEYIEVVKYSDSDGNNSIVIKVHTEDKEFVYDNEIPLHKNALKQLLQAITELM